MTAGPPVRESVEAFASLRARLSDPFADRSAVLADHGLDERSYSGIEAEWCGRLAAGGAGAEALAQAFGDAYSAALAARAARSGGEGAPALAEAFAAVSAPASDGMQVVVPAGAVEEKGPVSAEASRPIAVPSFLKDPKPAASVGVAAGPQPGAVPAPSVGVAPAVVSPAAAPAPQESTGAGFTGTAEVDLAALFKKSVPFNPGAKPAAPAPPAASPGPASPAPKPKSDLSGETAEVDIGAIARRVLAFGPSGSAPSSPGASAPSAPAPPAPAVPVSPAVMDSRGALSSAAPLPATPLPAAPDPRAQPALTLDQYAVLSAEVALVRNDPAARSAVFQRFGVANPEALLSEWRARLAADPALGGRWSAAYAHHYARLRTERGSSGGPPRAGGR